MRIVTKIRDNRVYASLTGLIEWPIETAITVDHTATYEMNHEAAAKTLAQLLQIKRLWHGTSRPDGTIEWDDIELGFQS